MTGLRRTLLVAVGLAAAACASSPPKPEPAEETSPAATTKNRAPAAAVPPVGSAVKSAVAVPSPSAAANAARHDFDDAVQRARAGDCRSAIPLLDSAVQDSPRLGWAYYDLGVCYERTGQTDRAADAYRRAVDLDPAVIQAADNLTRLYLRAGRASTGETVLADLAARHPKAVALHGDIARVLEAEGQYGRAADEAKKVLKADERNVPAMLELASIFYHRKQFELARMVTENARQIDSSNPLVFNTLGFLDLADKNKALALEDFRQAVTLDGDLPEAQNNLGALLVEIQDYPDAVQHLQAAVKLAPSFVPARINLGNAYRGNKQDALALKEYRRALEIDPAQKDAYFDLGVLFLDGSIPGVAPLDRLNQAVAYLQKFRGAGGEDPKLDRYVQDAQKAIGQEARHEEIDRRNKLRAAEAAKKKAADAAQKAAEAQKAAPGVRPASMTSGGEKIGDKLEDADIGAPARSNPKAGTKPPPPPAPPADKLGGDK